MVFCQVIVLGILPSLVLSYVTQTAEDLMFNVTSLDDFVSLLRHSDGRPVEMSEILFSETTLPLKRSKITDEGNVITPDCSPRNLSVSLTLDVTDRMVVYYPKCTVVQRCDGCVPTTDQSCNASSVDRVIVKVFRGRFPHFGAQTLEWEGYQNVELERHVSCHVVCKHSAETCGPIRSFVPQRCTCECIQKQCCNDNDTFCPYFFHPLHCQCIHKASVRPWKRRTAGKAWLLR